MTECSVSTKKGLNPLTIILIIVIGLFLILSIVFSTVSGQYTAFLEEIVDTLLKVATNILYLIGAGMLIFGASLVTIRFLR